MKNLKYILIGAFVLFVIAILIFLPKQENGMEQSPESLLLEITDNTRLISTDKMAELIINEDPTLLPVDVRPEAEFNKFTIPGSVNIPLGKMLDEEKTFFLGMDGMMKVFFSNDDLYANQAWMIAKRQGFKNVYLMKGGLNSWAETIIQPVEPPPTAPQEAFDLYHLRKATSLYFIGGSEELEPEKYEVAVKPKPVVAKKKIEVAPKKKKKVEEEGC